MLGQAMEVCDKHMMVSFPPNLVPLCASFTPATKVVFLKPGQANLLLKTLPDSPYLTAAFPIMCHNIKHSTNSELSASTALNNPWKLKVHIYSIKALSVLWSKSPPDFFKIIFY